jgi:hypothetical protein
LSLDDLVELGPNLSENFPAGGCGACIFPVLSAVDMAEAPLETEHTF